jgi:hypothetical protein
MSVSPYNATRWLIGCIAAIAIGLVAAPVVNADPGYSSPDLNFIANVTAAGYYGDKDRLIKTGHVVCELLDDGANDATVKAEVMIHHENSDPQFNALLFINYAAISYCPWQPAANWNI